MKKILSFSFILFLCFYVLVLFRIDIIATQRLEIIENEIGSIGTIHYVDTFDMVEIKCINKQSVYEILNSSQLKQNYIDLSTNFDGMTICFVDPENTEYALLVIQDGIILYDYDEYQRSIL